MYIIIGIVAVLLLFVFIYKKTEPFTHDPTKFKLKFEPTWYGGGYVTIDYTANGGATWKSVKEARKPLFDHNMGYNWTWENKTIHIDKLDDVYYKRLLGSYQKILDFEAAETKKYEDGYAERTKHINDYYQKQKDTLKKANS